jgi:hypothetical protein
MHAMSSFITHLEGKLSRESAWSEGVVARVRQGKRYYLLLQVYLLTSLYVSHSSTIDHQPSTLTATTSLARTTASVSFFHARSNPSLLQLR